MESFLYNKQRNLYTFDYTYLEHNEELTSDEIKQYHNKLKNII